MRVVKVLAREDLRASIQNGLAALISKILAIAKLRKIVRQYALLRSGSPAARLQDILEMPDEKGDTALVVSVRSHYQTVCVATRILLLIVSHRAVHRVLAVGRRAVAHQDQQLPARALLELESRLCQSAEFHAHLHELNLAESMAQAIITLVDNPPKRGRLLSDAQVQDLMQRSATIDLNYEDVRLLACRIAVFKCLCCRISFARNSSTMTRTT